MRFLNYLFHSQIKGEGNAGRRINSLVRIKIGLEEGDGYEPSMVIGPDYINIFGDKIIIDPHSGDNWEKHFSISQEMVDGSVVVTIKKLTQYPIIYTREEWSSETANK